MEAGRRKQNLSLSHRYHFSSSILSPQPGCQLLQTLTFVSVFHISLTTVGPTSVSLFSVHKDTQQAVGVTRLQPSLKCSESLRGEIYHQHFIWLDPHSVIIRIKMEVLPRLLRFLSNCCCCSTSRAIDEASSHEGGSRSVFSWRGWGLQCF